MEAESKCKVRDLEKQHEDLSRTDGELMQGVLRNQEKLDLKKTRRARMEKIPEDGNNSPTRELYQLKSEFLIEWQPVEFLLVLFNSVRQ